MACRAARELENNTTGTLLWGDRDGNSVGLLSTMLDVYLQN